MRYQPHTFGQRLCALVLLQSCYLSSAYGIDPLGEAQQAQQYAQQALEQKQWAMAEQWLERVLMYQPDNAEAQLDLAELLARRGRYGPAMALVQGLVDDARTPHNMLPGLLAILRNYSQAQEQVDGLLSNANGDTQQALFPPRLVIETYLGRSSNPAARTASSYLSLTTEGGDVDMPLQERPRSGWVAGAGLALAVAPKTELLTQWQSTTDPGAPSAYSLALQHQQGAWQWGGSSVRQFDSRQRHEMVLAYMQQQGRWHLGAFQETERRGWLLGWRHLIWLTGRGTAHVALDHEHQTGQPKAGGSNWRVEVAGRWQLGPALIWGLRYRHQQDLSGYSPLLANGQHRDLRSWHTTLDWAWLQNQQTYSGLQLYAVQRISNLPLFAYQDYGLQWVARYSWPAQAR